MANIYIFQGKSLYFFQSLTIWKVPPEANLKRGFFFFRNEGNIRVFVLEVDNDTYTVALEITDQKVSLILQKQTKL